MKVAHSVSDLIGETPVLRYPTKAPDAELFLKLEQNNPSHSMKDRMAVSMIDEAEKRGQLRPGGTIIESSSGNTATALAMIAAARGYRFIAVVDNQISPEKVGMLKAFGAELVFVEGGSEKRAAPQTRRDMAELLSKQIPDAFYANQAHNPNNPAGFRTLAREIADSVQNVRYLIGAIGTGGSLCGSGRVLKELKPDLRIIAVEPKGSTIFSEAGSAFYQTGTGKTPGTRTPQNIDYDVVDEHCAVTDREAFNAARFFARRMGMLLGGSASGVVYKALERIHAGQHPEGPTVAIIPDGGEKYLHSIFSDDWMTKHGLLDTSVGLRVRLWTVLKSEENHDGEVD
ncbi:MAG: cysteine synthase family protein [Candidatus Peregrinibacteria bacterium]